MERSPFTLEVQVVSGSHLPIADAWKRSSDPYVELWIGDRQIGRTKTIYSNLNPTWNETFQCNLLHRQCNMELKVFDEDMADPDFLGSIKIEVNELPVNREVQIAYSVDVAEAFKKVATTQPKVKVGLQLKRNNNLILIVPQQQQQPEAMLKLEDKVASVASLSCEPVNAIVNDSAWNELPHPIRQTFLDLAIEGYSKDCDEPLIFDLLRDTKSLFDGQDLNTDKFIRRRELKIQNASELCFDDLQYSKRYHPLQNNTIELRYHSSRNLKKGRPNQSDDSYEFLLLHFPDRLTTWLWIKWLRAAYEIWRSRIVKAGRPEWTKVNSIQALGSVKSSDGRSCEGKLTLNLDKEYCIVCGDQVFGMGALDPFFAVAVDTWEPKAYCLEVELLSIQAGENAQRNSIRGTGDSSKPHHQMKNVLNVVTAISKSKEKHLSATFRVGNHQHRFPDVSASSPTNVIEPSSPADFLRQSMQVDYNSGDLKTFALNATQRSGSPMIMDLFVSRGYEGKEKIMGYQHVKVNSIMQSIGSFNTATTFNEWHEADIALSGSIGFEILIEKIKLLSASNIANVGRSRGNFVIKYNLTDQNGEALHEPRRCSPVEAGAEKEFPVSVQVLFNSEDPVDRALTVAFELMLETQSTVLSLGHAILPMEYFSLKGQSYTLPLRRTLSSSSHESVVNLFPEDALLRGELKVKVKKVSNEMPQDPDKQLSVRLRTRILESHLVNNFWFGESMIRRGLVNTSSSSPEMLMVAVVLSGLKVELLPSSSGLQSPLASSRRRAHSFNGGNDTVLIPWDSILDWNVLSPSILSVGCRVERGLISERSQRAVETVEIDIFISNCPSYTLHGFIAQRMMFHDYRDGIQDLISSQSIYGSSKPVFLTKRSDDKEEVFEESKGSKIFSVLNDEIEDVIHRIAAVQEELDCRFDKIREQEKIFLVSQLCRCRLYKAALLSAGLTSTYNFYDLEETQSLLDAELYRVYHFEREDVVTTANYRIQWLINLGRDNIIDSILSASKYFEEDKNYDIWIEGVKLISNGIFTELLNILLAIFNNTTENEVKGLKNKLTLLHTYFQCDNSLGEYLEKVLQPFHLQPSGAITLSSFVNQAIITSWYSAELSEEMKRSVDRVLDAWKDPEKNGSNLRSEYHHDLPWYPHQEPSKILYSFIPEDLISYLNNYIKQARFPRNELSPKLWPTLDKLESKVCVAYCNAFIFLAENYLSALKSKDLSNLADSEFSEYTTFLLSAINDCRRILYYDIVGLQLSSASRSENRMIKPKVDIKIVDPSVLILPEMKSLVSHTLETFEDIEAIASDQLCCMIARFVIFDYVKKPDLINGYHWLDACRPASTNSPTHDITCLYEIVDGMLEAVDDNSEFLMNCSWRILKHVFVNKILLLVFILFYQADKQQLELSPDDPLVTGISQAVAWLDSKLSAWVLKHTFGDEDQKENDILTMSFRILKLIPILLQESDPSCLVDALTQMQSIVKPLVFSDRFAVAVLLKACLKIRGIPLDSQEHAPSASPSPSPSPSITASSGKPDKSRNLSILAHGRRLLGSWATNPPSSSPKVDPRRSIRLSQCGLTDSVDDVTRKEQALKDTLSICLDDLLTVSGQNSKPREGALKIINTPISLVFSASSNLDGSLGGFLLSSLVNDLQQTDACEIQIGKLSRAGHVDFCSIGGSRLHNLLCTLRLRSSDSQDENKAAINRGIEPERFLLLRDLQVTNLFHLNFFHPPRPYFEISLGDWKQRTPNRPSAQSADWREEKPFLLPIYRQRSTATQELKISLFYEGVRCDHLVGSWHLPIDLHSPQAFQEKSFELNDVGQEAQRAAMKAKSEGRSLPVLSFTLLPSE